MAVITWVEILLRWFFGLQMVFWGLNGFFHWKPIPRSEDFITRFSDLCLESRFLLPTVKVFEIFFGALLLSGSGILVSLIFLGPIVFVITGLHLFHNPKAWQVLLPITVPFLLIVILNWRSIQTLLLY
jgi:uncharacterized membrane protein YphA (DoxX/SURF4 family)